ncbi:MAG: hypothetical protein ACI85I_000203 [Arenicella sp.]|jgi:hypothetical protein
MKLLCIISLLIASLSSCTSQIDENPIFDPFEINYNVSEKGLTNNDYTIIPEDVPLFGKQIKDTLIYYQLDDECDSLTRECINTTVITRFCYIFMNQADTVLLKKLLDKYDVDIISDFSHQNEIYGDSTDLYYYPHSEWGFHGIFFAKHRFTKKIFECHIGGASGVINDKIDGFELSIRNEFPWTDKEKKVDL